MDDKIVSAKSCGRLATRGSAAAIRKRETEVMPLGWKPPAGITFVARLPIQEMIQRR